MALLSEAIVNLYWFVKKLKGTIQLLFNMIIFTFTIKYLELYVLMLYFSYVSFCWCLLRTEVICIKEVAWLSMESPAVYVVDWQYIWSCLLTSIRAFGHISCYFQVDDNICKFAKKGLTPSQIGVILRDSHGIAQVKSVTGNKILRILKAHGTSSSL